MFVENGKIASDLSVFLQLPEGLREKSNVQSVFSDAQRWELLVKYSGDLKKYEDLIGFQGEYIGNGIAIVFIEPSKIKTLAELAEVEYIEAPKRLWYQVEAGKRESCINPLQSSNYVGNNETLFGNGVIVAIIDSGIDYAHPDFRKDNGATRLIGLWDQTVQPRSELEAPPEGFLLGTFFSEEQINDALQKASRQEQLEIVPSVDISGHGTHVAGIACGNGRASGGRNRGVASQADILVVKLGDAQGVTFPRTTRLLEAVYFAINVALTRQQPIVVNLSFGNNAGPHTGMDLVSEYLNQEALRWQNSICIGTGNEANLGRHKEGNLKIEDTQKIECLFSQEQGSLAIEFWKNYEDRFSFQVQSPDGERVLVPLESATLSYFDFRDTILITRLNGPTPFENLQELYLEWIPKGDYIKPGIWTILLQAEEIVQGRYDLWLPTGAYIQQQTRILNPTLETTLTTPSSAARLISVGAYNDETEQIAPFSGRGPTRLGQLKPDLIAPGVNILSTAPNGSYTVRSGTSMAVPFVSGSCALLMEWGIVKGNSPFLYGEKMKAFLRAGARPLNHQERPDNIQGYGRLCVKNSIDFERRL